MKKARRCLGLLLAGLVGFNSIPVFATSDDVNDISPDLVRKIQITVSGNGQVVLDDYESKYTLESGDFFRANCTEGTRLNLSLNPNEGNEVDEVTINGKEFTNIEYIEDRGNFNYLVPKDGAIIDVSFKEKQKDTSKGGNSIKNETTNGIKKPVVLTPEQPLVEDKKEEVIVPTPSISTATTVTTETTASTITSGAVVNSSNTELDPVLPPEELAIMEQYNKGIKMLPEQIEARKKKATDLGLLDMVDKNYFLVDDYYKDKSHYDLEKSGVAILIDVTTDEELKAWSENLKNGFVPLVVTSYNQVSWNGSTVGQFTVDGSMAFCAEHSRRTPAANSPTGAPSVVYNDTVRQCLYYGYDGPGNAVAGTPSNSEGWVLTSLGLSHANIGGGGSKAQAFVNKVSALPVPGQDFEVYEVTTNGGSTQDLMYWALVPTVGQLQISKQSGNTAITGGNNNYSVVGAQYGVYNYSNATGHVATLTIGSNGWSNEIDLNAGTYYIKEIKSPPGYALDTNIYTVSVTSGNKTTRTFTDTPQTDPIGILLRKVDAGTGQNKPVGSGSLADAHFSIKFYGGNYADGVNPADLGVAPTKTWVMKTDQDGFCYLDNAYKVSGDPFYYNIANVPTLPLGTVTIQEIKPPIGYKIDPTIYVRKVTPNGSVPNVNTYNEPIVREESLDFTIMKVQEGTNIKLPNVQFKHTRPDGSSVLLTTNPNGEIVIRGITQGIHRIQEVKTTDGFLVNPNEFVFEVTANNTINVRTNTTNLGMVYNNNNGNGVLTVENKLAPFKIKVVKTNDKNSLLADAEFTLYSDPNCTNVVGKAVSNANGEIYFDNLKVGTPYYLKETQAPPGYRIPLDPNGQVHVYEIRTSAKPSLNQFFFTIDGVRYDVNSTTGDMHLEGTKADRVISMKVVNLITMKLPTTGSNAMIPLLIAGMSLMVIALKRSKNKN